MDVTTIFGFIDAMPPVGIALTGFAIGAITDRLLVLVAHWMTNVPDQRR